MHAMTALLLLVKPVRSAHPPKLGALFKDGDEQHCNSTIVLVFDRLSLADRVACVKWKA